MEKKWLVIVDEGYEKSVYEHDSQEEARNDYEYEKRESKESYSYRKVCLATVIDSEEFEGGWGSHRHGEE
jgi:hypothetical protein